MARHAIPTQPIGFSVTTMPYSPTDWRRQGTNTGGLALTYAAMRSLRGLPRSAHVKKAPQK